MKNSKQISISCPINTSGYGISSYNIVDSLHRIDKDIILFPMGGIDIDKQWNHQTLNTLISKQSKLDIDSNLLKIFHADSLIIAPRCKGKYASYTFFEVNKLKTLEKLGYDMVDTIIAPTHWAKDVLINNDINESKIVVIPPGVDRNTFKPLEISDQLQKAESYHSKYIFLNVGKWEIRKGHDILIHLFNNAFNEKDNVELWMVNNNPHISHQQNQQWENIYKNTKLSDKIKIFPRLQTQQDLSTLMNMSSCGIFPSRAEGWNNEAIEMMAMNKPIILSNYSAHTEYANADNSFLIDIQYTETADDGLFFDGTGEWAKLDSAFIDNAVDIMRFVYSNNIHTNNPGLSTTNHFSWTKTATRIAAIYE